MLSSTIKMSTFLFQIRQTAELTMDSEDDDTSIPEKRLKTQLESCIIYSAKAPVGEPTTPRGASSSKPLLRATEIQRFAPITGYAQEENVPCVYCHCLIDHAEILLH